MLINGAQIRSVIYGMESILIMPEFALKRA